MRSQPIVLLSSDNRDRQTWRCGYRPKHRTM